MIRDTPNENTTDGVIGTDAHEILITLRKENTVFPGYWELPGGKAEPGEPIDDCVRRELSEEVGVLVEVTGSLLERVHVYPHATVRLHPRLCRLVADSPAPSNLHVADHRWCRLSELGAYRFPPANDAIIAELISRLSR